VGCPTVREPDGLALSSRNRFLSSADRVTALALSRALRAGAEAAPAGPAEVTAAAQAVLDEAVKSDPPLQLDYLVLVEAATFTEVPQGFAGTAVLAVAGRVGTTHLIDNMIIEFSPAG
jgi:pantoate--beta-alanine ligase